MTRWVGLPLIEGQDFVLHPASLSILGQDPHRPEVRVMESWNQTRATQPAR